MLERGAQESVIGGGAVPTGDLGRYNNTFVIGEAGSAFNTGTDGNYTVYLNMPLFSDDAFHAGVSGGDEWDIDDEEYADMTISELEWLRDQSNFRTIAPYYDLTDDSEDDFQEDLEKVTNCFAIKFGLNTTVSTTDGAGTQVNFTINPRDSNDIPAEVVVDGVNIWVIFYEPITCYDGMYNFDVGIEFGHNIYLGNITTCRLATPEDDDNLGASVDLNTAELIHYLQHGGVA